jgi:hypothetical protein
MAVHAGLGIRHAGERRCLDGRVAIPTVKPQLARMKLMAERNRLGNRGAYSGKLRGTEVEPIGRGEDADE